MSWIITDSIDTRLRKLWEIVKDREAWYTAVHGVAKNRTWLRDWTTVQETSRLPWWLSGKESACQCRRCEFNPWVRKIPWRRGWQPFLVFLPGESHGQRSLVGFSPKGQRESDTTERPNKNSVVAHDGFHTKCKVFTFLILYWGNN